MAEVWRGHDLILQRPVAIKLLHPHLANDEVVIERFRREAISAAKLNHPHIVPTYDAGTDKGATFIVLGLVHGPSLAEVMKTREISEREAVGIARQIADALDYAHRSGLIHRDIKPANILVVDEEKRIMVGDFGIAKAIAEAGSESLTLPGFVIGTPAYVAPEVLNGAEPDARADIYALGVLLHELLCNHDSIDQPTQLSAAAPAEDATECSDLPGALSKIVSKATHTAPAGRYADAAGFRSALEDYERTLLPKRHTTSRKPQASTGQPTVMAEVETGGERTTQHTIVPKVEPESAPRGGTKVRRRAVTTAVIILLVLGAVIVGRVVGSLGGHGSGATTTSTASRAPLSFTASHSFDPKGDGKENEEATGRAMDGNAATVWSTSTYNSRKFGNLKPGVGLVLTLDSSRPLADLQVDSPSSGWAASVYLSDSDPSTLEDWGQPVASGASTPGTTHFDLHGNSASHVLLWFTDLGAANKVSVSEVHATASR
jgi:tRNA A-37 threonylcarbamoyl transferase component Bud32